MQYAIGENIRKYRKINGISQKYLAARIGISAQGLLKIEKGLVSPKVTTIERVMENLCITPNQLFGVEEISEENSSILERLKEANRG